ncbi:MAG: hypothetical protein IKU35_03300 [Bacteroidaceae bacterium]|jgi:hypothetical protein|nr:hypothetical protein [Bacteroidaceae bacterium]MBR5276150.1 hypothetical protein [Bacteroidaceae bacterium]MBR5891579.1 hypothetical protein [Bacteroidaceae bacterium]
MIKVLLLTTLIVAICMVLMAITILLKKNGRFPNIHVGTNKHMRQRGIGCVETQDKQARLENPHAIPEREK